MAIIIADGTTLAMASTYGTAVTMSALTNATEAVATLAVGHGVVVGDFLEVTSGWPTATGRIFRAKTVATNDVTLEGFDTTSTTVFPAGTGIGSIRRITAWTGLSQITSFGVNGGDQNYFSYQFLDQLQKQQIPTSKEPVIVEMEFADDPGLAQLGLLRAAETRGTPNAFRMIFRGGSGVTPPRTLINGIVSLGTLPSIAIGQANTRKFSVALAGLPVEYNS